MLSNEMPPEVPTGGEGGEYLYNRRGVNTMLIIAIGVFVVAWIGQFIGHHIEGKRPSFFTDLTYLLVGPLWTLNKLYRRIGLG